MTARGRRALLGVAGVAIGALALMLTFARFGWEHGPTVAARVTLAELEAAIARTHGGWLLAFLVANLASIPLRALQLRAVAVREGGDAPRFGACFRAVAVGVLAHNVLPARLGEAARAVVLSRDGGVSLPRSAGALLVGRSLDLLALLAVSCGLPALLGLPASRLPSLRGILVGGSLVAAALALVIAALLVGRAPLARRLAPRSPRLARVIDDLGAGLSSVARPARLLPALLASLAVPLALAASIAFALRALSIDAATGTSLVFVGAMLLGVAIPAAPSSVGVYHALCAVVLGALGVALPDAVAFGLVTHATSTVAGCIVGAISLGRAKLLGG